MKNSYCKRLAQVEAMANSQKAELEETLMTAYVRACREENENEAACLARKIRNKLLDKSDKIMALDRLEFDISSPTKLIASFANVFSSEWAQYRQALRDLPKQAGFPFDVEFPLPPEPYDEK